jgi:hypothetical protein
MNTKGELPLSHEAVWDPDDCRPNVMGITLILAFVAIVWFVLGFGVGYVVWA